MRINRIRERFVKSWPLVLMIGLAAFTQLQFPPQYDENSHLNFTHYIAQHPTWHTLVTYEGSENYEAKAPFVFIVGAAVGSITRFTLPVMRFLVFVSALIGVCFFNRVVRLMNSDAMDYRSSSVVLIPYFLILSLTYMTDMPTLALMYISFYGLLRSIERSSNSYLIYSILASTAMLYIRIDAAFIIAGVCLGCASQGLVPRRMILGVLVPLLLRLPLIIVWGGLAAPTAQLRPNPVHLVILPVNAVFSLCVIGFYFLPFSLVGLNRRLRPRLLFSAIGILLLFCYFPNFSELNPDHFGGSLRSFLQAAISASSPVRIAVLGVLLIAGVQVLFSSCCPVAGEALATRAIKISCVLGVVMQVAHGDVMFERYLFPLFGFLSILLLWHRNHNNSFAWYFWSGEVIILQLIQLRQHHVI